MLSPRSDLESPAAEWGLIFVIGFEKVAMLLDVSRVTCSVLR